MTEEPVNLVSGPSPRPGLQAAAWPFPGVVRAQWSRVGSLACPLAGTLMPSDQGPTLTSLNFASLEASPPTVTSPRIRTSTSGIPGGHKLSGHSMRLEADTHGAKVSGAPLCHTGWPRPGDRLGDLGGWTAHVGQALSGTGWKRAHPSSALCSFGSSKRKRPRWGNA